MWKLFEAWKVLQEFIFLKDFFSLISMIYEHLTYILDWRWNSNFRIFLSISKKIFFHRISSKTIFNTSSIKNLSPSECMLWLLNGLVLGKIVINCLWIFKRLMNVFNGIFRKTTNFCMVYKMKINKMTNWMWQEILFDL